MGLELAKAYVRVRADSSQLKGDLGKTKGPLTMGMAALAGGISGAIVNQAIAVARQAAGAVISIMRQSIGLAERQIQAEMRIAAVVRATGGAAGYTAEQLKKMASEMQKRTTFGDEEILESMALLSTFKSIAGDAFERTIEAAQDLSSAGFGPLRSIIMGLAKAVEDPARQMSILRRSGVTLSEVQEKHIKQLQKEGNLRGAQSELLAAIEGQAKGLAEELAKTDPGRLQQLKNVLGDLYEEFGKRLLPIVVKFYEALIVVAKTADIVIDAIARINKVTNGWAVRILIIIPAVVGAFLAYKAVMFGVGLAIAAYTAIVKSAMIATVFFQAIAGGPKGWLVISAGVAYAALLVNQLKKAMQDTTGDLQNTTNEAKEATDALNEMGDASSSIDSLTDSVGVLNAELKRLSQEASTALSTLKEDFPKAVLPIAYLERMLKSLQVRRGISGEPKGEREKVLEENLRILKKTRTAGAEVLAVFNDFDQASTIFTRLQEQLKTPIDKLEELKQKLDFFVKKGWMDAADAVKLYDNEVNKIGITPAEKALSRLQEETFQLLSNMDKFQSSLRDFSLEEGVDSTMIEMAKGLLDVQRIHEQDNELIEEGKKKQEDLMNAGKSMAEGLRTPLEKYRNEMERIKELSEAEAITGETKQRAEIAALKELKGGPVASDKSLLGRRGIPELGRSLQDAITRGGPDKDTDRNQLLKQANVWNKRIWEEAKKDKPMVLQ